jgi:putative redox protein
MMTPPATDAPADPAPAPEVIAELGPTGLLAEITAGPHHLRSDATAESGGGEAAPRPFHMLLGALGACTAMTIRMYADRKGWSLEGVRVALSHDRRKAAAGEAGATDAGWVFTIETRIELLGGGLDAEQRQRLMEIGEKCPVNQALRSQVQITHILT